MKISIIIPVYNKEAYISLCMESLLQQDFDDYEIVCVNDGSTDHSGDICDQWARKSPIIKVIHTENGGVTSARRRGVQEARGRYIVFSDADDKLMPHALSTLYRAIEASHADEVIGRYITQHGHLSPLVCDGMVNDIAPLIKAIVTHKNTFPILWGLICRKELVADCLDTPREVYEGEDLLMQLKMLMKHPSVFFIRDCVYLYTEGLPNNRVRTLAREQYFDTQLRQVLAPEWEQYRTAYVTHQIKQYEEFLVRGDSSVRSAYYAQVIPSPLPPDLSWLRRLFWQLPAPLSLMAMKLYRYLITLRRR